MWMDVLKGLQSYGRLSTGGLVSPNIQRPLAAKLRVGLPKVFEVHERARDPLSPCQVWRGSDFTRRRGGQKRWVFICLFVMLFNVWACAPDFATKALEYRNDLMPLDRAMFVVVQCNRFQLSQIAANWRHHKMPKSKNGNWRFFAARGRQNKPIETKFGT